MARNYGTGGPKAGQGTNGAGSSEREDLANFISMITRDETPFMSSIGKTKANAILHEWQTDELATPGSFPVSEGVGFNDVQQSAGTPNGPYRTRLGNYTQINSKTVSVSGTKRAVDQAGVADEYAYQLKKRGTELRRDVEWDLVHSSNSSSQGGAVSSNVPAFPGQFTQSPARTFGGYQSFINYWNGLAGASAGAATAANNGGNLFISGPSLVVTASGAVPSYIGATPYTAAAANGGWVRPSAGGTGISGTVTTGTGGNDANLSSLQLSAVDQLMQNIYQNGGKADKLMVSPANRRAFSARAQAAGASSSGLSTTGSGAGNVRRNIDEAGSLRQSVEIYMSDFGDIMVVPNYIMGLSAVGSTRVVNAVDASTGNSSSTQTAVTVTADNDTQDYFGLVYDSMWFNYASLRPLQEVDLGQLGDSIIGQIVEEGTLEVRNPKGCGIIVGLNGQ